AAEMNNDGGIPVFGGNGVNGFHDKANVQEPTLVIGRVGYYCGSIHITPEKAWVTDNAFITRYARDDLSQRYLYWLLKATNLKEQDNATAQPVISGRKIYPIVVIIAPRPEQDRISNKIDELMAFCDQLKSRIVESKQIQVNLSYALTDQAINAS
ncbi:restriction endonuclease subunit S, partial [Marinobacter alexandrii]